MLKLKEAVNNKRKFGQKLTTNDMASEGNADLVLAQTSQDKINKLKEEYVALLYKELNLKDDSLNNDIAVAKK